MKNYYIIDDAWNVIKTYLFHNIKTQGKHLQNRKHVFLYNKVVKSIPIIKVPMSGPLILYYKTSSNISMAKFLYYGKELSQRNRYPKFNTIIEIIAFDTFRPKYNTLFGMNLTTKNNVSSYYYQNVFNVKSKLT